MTGQILICVCVCVCVCMLIQEISVVLNRAREVFYITKCAEVFKKVYI